MAAKRIEEIARLLGWDPPKKYRHLIADDKLQRHPIIWYESGADTDILLQINEAPVLCACVFAMRYRICSGWHEIHVSSRKRQLDLEVRRVSDWIHRSWFESATRRRVYRKMHPECTNYTWRKLEEEGAPYSV